MIKAATFTLVPFYSFLISPTEYGYIYTITAFVTFVSLFVTFSMHGVISRFYCECKTADDVAKLYSTIVYTVAIISIFISSITMIFSDRISLFLKIPSLYLKMAILSASLLCFYQMITALLYIKQDATKISFISIGVGVVQIVIQLSLVLSLQNKAFAMILSQLVCSVLMFIIFVIFSISYLRMVFDKKRIWIYLKYAICLLPSDISSWFMGLSDRMMMNIMKGSAITGIYGMGQTLGNIPKVAYSSINKAYVPFVLNSYKEIERGDDNKVEELRRHTTLIFSIVTILTTLLVVFTRDIIGLLDDRFSGAFVVMAIMLLTVLIDSYRTIFMIPLTYNLKYTKVNSMIWVFSALLSFGLNMLLIPRFSIYGACFTMVVTYFTTFLLTFIFSRKAYTVSYYDIIAMIKIFVTSILISLLFFLPSSLGIIPIKMFLIIAYLYVVLKIAKLDYKLILSRINFF